MDEFLSSLRKIPTASEMAQWDKSAVEFGITETMLMENAGRAIIIACSEKFGSLKNRLVCLFMGGGNNGGDAACIARHIQDAGGQAVVFCLKEPASLAGAAAFHVKLANADGAVFAKLAPGFAAADFLAYFARTYGALPDLLVDGLLGTGFHGPLKPELERTVSLLNDLAGLSECPVLAIDIPSGLDSTSGMPAPTAVKATLTVTLAAPKPGLLLPHAREWTGELVCRSIGIPKAVLADCDAGMRLLDGRSLMAAPAVAADSFKNIYGHVFVFGGSQGYAGAAHLACAGALRAGCGLVTACAPAAALAQIKAGSPEIMTHSLNIQAQWPGMVPEDLERVVSGASAFVIGPGMGRTADAAVFLEQLLAWKGRPAAVIDADALALLAERPALWKYIGSDDILTPHPGEAAMLLGVAGRDVQKDRFEALDRLCAFSPAVVALKGAATIIGQQNGVKLLCPYDIPQLAIGGAGDVLAGCLGALLASGAYSGLSSLAKAGVGVILHVMAGLKCAREYQHRGLTASQLADAIAHARDFATSEAAPLEGLLPWPR